MSHIVHRYDAETNQVIERDMTTEEVLELEAYQTSQQALKEQKKQEEETLRETKISAYQKLGLTEAEIEALLPISKPDIRPILGGN